MTLLCPQPLTRVCILNAQVSAMLPYPEREAHAVACSGGTRLLISGGDNPAKGMLDDILLSPCTSEALCRT
jgi:hypothetical protein